MQVHALKRYLCATCSASFGLSRGLTRHKKACHKRILCATCHVAFTTQEDLKLHCQLSQHEEFVLLLLAVINVLHCVFHIALGHIFRTRDSTL